MKFVIMRRDELGEVSRAYGSDFLEKVHIFPCTLGQLQSDRAICLAFNLWRETIEMDAQIEWDESHASGESTLFLERLYSDMSLSEWQVMDY